MTLQEKIKHLFSNHNAPTQLINNDGDIGSLAKNWQDVTDLEVALSSQALIFLEWEECLYFLPRFLNWVLDDIDGKIPPELHVVIYLFPWIVGNWQKLKNDLGREKIKLVKEFLIVCEQDPNYSLDIVMTGIDPHKYEV